MSSTWSVEVKLLNQLFAVYYVKEMFKISKGPITFGKQKLFGDKCPAQVDWRPTAKWPDFPKDVLIFGMINDHGNSL